MKRGAVIGLKLFASIPLALIIGGVAARILENGLWPLLFFPDHWLAVFDFATVTICQITAFGALIWFWVLDRQ